MFVTFDLDALDPGILPGTGTPEPGGLDWYEAVDLLARGLAALAHRRASTWSSWRRCRATWRRDFLAARLVYRMIGLALASVPSSAAAGSDRPMPQARRALIVLRTNQDRRVRGGHPWIFSNEVAEIEGAPEPGGLVEITD